MRKFMLMLVLCFLLMPAMQTNAAEKPYTFFDDSIKKPSNIWYVGNFNGVDFYGVSLEQLNALLPWVQVVQQRYNIDGLSIIVSNNNSIEISDVIAFDQSQYYMSQNLCLDSMLDSMGEYRPNGDIVVLRSDADIVHLQLAMLHEIGHHIDYINGRPSDSIDAKQLEAIRIWSSALGTPCISTVERFTTLEAFAEMFALQQVGVLPQ